METTVTTYEYDLVRYCARRLPSKRDPKRMLLMTVECGRSRTTEPYSYSLEELRARTKGLHASGILLVGHVDDYGERVPVEALKTPVYAVLVPVGRPLSEVIPGAVSPVPWPAKVPS